MNNNTKVETAQKSQAANKKTSKVPTGKVTLMKDTEARKKAREEQYRNFRINALRRRCERMKFDDEKTEELVKKLIEQMNAPKEYSILVMLDGCKGKKIPNPDGEGELFKSAGEQFKEDLEKKNIKYKYCGSTYFSLDGDQDVLTKIREIAPDGAKIYPYAKKMESVIPKEDREKVKKPTNNTAEKKAAAKAATFKGRGSARAIHRMQIGRLKDKITGEIKPIRTHGSEKFNKNGKLLARRKPSPRPNAGTNKTKVKIGKRAWIKANSTQAVLSLAERIAKQKATTVQFNAKKGSKGSKKASTNVKKAA